MGMFFLGVVKMMSVLFGLSCWMVVLMFVGVVKMVVEMGLVLILVLSLCVLVR